MDAATARKLIDYNPLTGVLTWKVRRSQRVFAGERAGGSCGEGYLSLRVNQVNYKAHRVAWLIHFGEWPKGFIDHINGNRSDNRLENLRDVTPKQNAQNITAPRSGSRSGMVGVSAHNKKWRAAIMRNGVRHLLGDFESPEDASKAYQAAKSDLDKPPSTLSSLPGAMR